MKIQLDFTNKIISIEETVSLSDMMKKIKSILPDWKEWQLASSNSTIYWTDPIIWDWKNPYYGPTMVYNSSNAIDQQGTYCLEVN